MIKILHNWFIAFFALTCLVPLYGKFLDTNIELSGVTNDPENISLNIINVFDGTYQTHLNDLWENNFPGRKFLLRIRNQLLYSAFNVSPNSNVVIGKEKYLYEPLYILFETQAYAPSSEEYFDSLGKNLLQLKELLEDNGKELYVFITPSKAHFCKEYLPERYMFLENSSAYSYTNYSKLIEVLDYNNIMYYDAVNYIEENINSGVLKSPVFYKSGIHWSHSWGESAASEFLDYMNSCSKYNLSTISIKEYTSTEPVSPATDLYSSLNLLFEPKEQWYATEHTIVNRGSDNPNIFLRGGSFMGQSLSVLLNSGVFGKDVHLENSYYFTDKYTSLNSLSAFTAYDELDMDTLAGQTDIFVLEVNEGAIYTMSFGFIDYLLEHPEYLDRNY